MGIYPKYLLPHVIDLAMRNKETARVRAAWLPQARGEVLDVGIGSGLNLPFCSESVKSVYGIDPSVDLLKMAHKKVVTKGIKLEFFLRSAEKQLPLPDSSMDTVVVTWTLCSIADAPRALRQIRRVLKLSGHLIFVEHGRSPDPRVALWQERITPLWKRMGGGCHLNRKIDELIRAAGFRITELKTCYLPGPRPMTYTYQGLAEKDLTCVSI